MIMIASVTQAADPDSLKFPAGRAHPGDRLGAGPAPCRVPTQAASLSDWDKSTLPPPAVCRRISLDDRAASNHQAQFHSPGRHPPAAAAAFLRDQQPDHGEHCKSTRFQSFRARPAGRWPTVRHIDADLRRHAAGATESPPARAVSTAGASEQVSRASRDEPRRDRRGPRRRAAAWAGGQRGVRSWLARGCPPGPLPAIEPADGSTGTASGSGTAQAGRPELPLVPSCVTL
jgi:hypothetical protein